MNFGDLQQRIVALLRQRVSNGEVSERRLARMLGISQPHMHNVLRGKRSFSIETADAILRRLRLDLLDLFEPPDRTKPRPRG